MIERVKNREGLIRSFWGEAFPVCPPSEIVINKESCFFGFPLSQEEAKKLLRLTQPGVSLTKDERVRAWRLPFGENKNNYLL